MDSENHCAPDGNTLMHTVIRLGRSKMEKTNLHVRIHAQRPNFCSMSILHESTALSSLTAY